MCFHSMQLQCEGSGAQEEFAEEETDVSKGCVEGVVQIIRQSRIMQAGMLCKLKKFNI